MTRARRATRVDFGRRRVVARENDASRRRVETHRPRRTPIGRTASGGAGADARRGGTATATAPPDAGAARWTRSRARSAGDDAWFAALDDDALERAMATRDDDGRTSFHRACAAGARGRACARLACERMTREAIARAVGARTTVDGRRCTRARRWGSARRAGRCAREARIARRGRRAGRRRGHYAASKGHVGTLETLMRASRGWMTMEDDVGATPLHRAAARGELRAIDFLVDALANGTTEAPKTALEARDKRGQTPLLVACEAGQDEAAIRLAKHGANVGAKDGEKRGVEELAPKLVSALAQIEAER